MKINRLLKKLLTGQMFTMYIKDPDAEGIIQNDTGEAEGTGNDDRIARLNAIADQSEEQRADELAHVNDDDTTEPFQTTKSEDDTEHKDDKQENVPEDTPVTKYKITVGGVEKEVTLEELMALAQAPKQETPPRQRQEPVRQVDTGPSEEELQRLQDEEDLALVRAIQMGNEKEAAAAIRKLRDSAAKTVKTISPEEVYSTVDERLEFKTAMREFRKNYSDIVSDPRLFQLARQRDAELVDQGDTRDYSERYAAIGNELREWLKSTAPKKETPPSGDLDAKHEKKAAAPKTPVAASTKVQPAKGDDDDVDDTPSSVIAKMRETRGGPQWMRA